MKKKNCMIFLIFLMQYVFPSSSFATDSKSSLNEIVCSKYKDGWQVFNIQKQPMGPGSFADKSSCQKSLNGIKNGYVCTAQLMGGVSVVDIDRNKKLTEYGQWNSLVGCLDGLKYSKGPMICEADINGFTLYHKNFGALGSKKFSRFFDCQSALDNSANQIVCAPNGSGFVMLSIESGRRMGSWAWIDLPTCLYASQAMVNGRMCLPTKNEIQLTDLKTGQVEGIFNQLDECISHL